MSELNFVLKDLLTATIRATEGYVLLEKFLVCFLSFVKFFSCVAQTCEILILNILGISPKISLIGAYTHSAATLIALETPFACLKVAKV